MTDDKSNEKNGVVKQEKEPFSLTKENSSASTTGTVKNDTAAMTGTTIPDRTDNDPAISTTSDALNESLTDMNISSVHNDTKDPTTGTEEDDDDTSSTTPNGTFTNNPTSAAASTVTVGGTKKLLTRHERAVAAATASADASYRPSLMIMNSSNPQDLIGEVDGILLTEESLKEAQTSSSPLMYQASGVPLKMRDTLEIPIMVTTSGSVVQYKLSTQSYDVGFSIVAHRGFTSTTTSKKSTDADNDEDTDEKTTTPDREEDNNDAGTTSTTSTSPSEIVVVRQMARVNSHLESIQGKFLVGTVPTRLVFCFDNSYSWFHSKSVSYKIEVTPPSYLTIVGGRRRRAKAALSIVKEDFQVVEHRLDKTQRSLTKLEQQIDALKQELALKEDLHQKAKEEETLLQKRSEVRQEQTKALETRLSNGWPDERLLERLRESLEASSKSSETAFGSTATATADDVANVIQQQEG